MSLSKQHQYLRARTEKGAEARGYRVSIEEPVMDGQESIDLFLEQGGKRIACKIGVRIGKEWEIYTLLKYLKVVGPPVLVVLIDKNEMEIMQKQISEKIDADFKSRIFVMDMDALFFHLDAENAKEASYEKRIRGYKVKVEYTAISEDEMRQKRAAVAKAIFDSIMREKNQNQQQ